MYQRLSLKQSPALVRITCNSDRHMCPYTLVTYRVYQILYKFKYPLCIFVVFSVKTKPGTEISPSLTIVRT